MKILNNIIKQACVAPGSIVLAEGDDIRVIEAAARATRDGVANCLLVGDPETIETLAHEAGISLGDIRIEDPVSSTRTADYAQNLLDLRAKKGMTIDKAQHLVLDQLHFANLMVQAGDADGTIAGARYTSGDCVRAALQIIGVAPGIKTVSSFFLMIFEAEHHEPKQAMLFADCALVVDPTAEQLADIAIATTQSAQRLLERDPSVAMLSFSTNGSADHPFVDKVREATGLVRKSSPQLAIDGDIQLDAALVPSIIERKMPNSKTRGNANVLIFPDLNAANIGYKIAQRLGGAIAIGPIMQGLNHPANDLSRGCSADDVYYLIAMTVVQTQG
ncbi:MAG: phosphate acetyltransferase [Gammaproteobacteria bacterium]|nr:phosphate acetyltransferase [Gammaproteobacteria bacterium]